MTGLYFQPSVIRSNDNSLPTAPDQGLDVGALIDELTNRIEEAHKKIEFKVDNNALAKIILTDRDIVLMGDQVSIVGQLNIVDWIRDISGNITGGIDASSITRITGGKIQTGVIESVNWSTSAGSQFDLDNGTIVTGGSSAPKFSVSNTGVLTCIDAIITGTLQAGSIIAGSVTINDALGPTLDDIAAGVDIQAALDAGVTNILAGVGSDFLLDVNVTSGYAIFRHKDAVFLGAAAAGSVKPALGISSSGIAMGYNRSSDGGWVTSVAIDASGNAAFLGTITAGSVITNSVTVSGTPLSTILNNAQAGKDISDDLKVSGTTILRGVLQPNNTGAVAVGSITWNSSTGALTGGTGIAITEWGIIGADSGAATFSLEAATGNAIFKGDISGGANIDITGMAKFGGNSSAGGNFAAAHANVSFASKNGIIAYSDATSQSRGVWGNNASSSGSGVYGISSGTSGAGVRGVGSASNSIGVAAEHSLSGVALQVSGRMTINNSTLVTNLNAQKWNGFTTGSITTGGSTATFNSTNKPGSNSSNSWWVVSDGTTTIRIPVWLT